MTEFIDGLLGETTIMRRAYELTGRKPGERFNLFQILGLESDEVRTHSSILAELLNPAGSHDMGAIFLELFLKQFDIQDFTAAGAKVTVEFFIGKVTELDGGRIDLVIENNGKRILIENKIFARDQPNQMLRYHRFDPSAKLYYLTLFGTKPDENSIGKMDTVVKDYFTCISYENDMLQWLESCYKESSRYPSIREGIAQYLELIKKLTNQNVDGKMKTDLINKILSSPDNIQSFIELQSLTKPVYANLIERWKPDLTTMAQDLGMWIHVYLEPGKRWQGFALGGEEFLTEAGIQITFQFDNFPHMLIFGFTFPPDPANGYKPLNKGKDLSALKERFHQEFKGTQQAPWWVAYKIWDAPADVICSEILSGKINDTIREKVQAMLKIAREALI